MNALPISFAMVSGHPHVSGAYGRDWDVAASAYGHAGIHIQIAKIANPTSRPATDEIHAFPSLNLLDCGSALLRCIVQHAIPATSVAAERIA